MLTLRDSPFFCGSQTSPPRLVGRSSPAFASAVMSVTLQFFGIITQHGWQVDPSQANTSVYLRSRSHLSPQENRLLLCLSSRHRSQAVFSHRKPLRVIRHRWQYRRLSLLSQPLGVALHRRNQNRLRSRHHSSPCQKSHCWKRGSPP